MSGRKFAWQCAIVAMGITYISHVLQFTASQVQTPGLERGANAMVWLSMLLGLIAGLALLH